MTDRRVWQTIDEIIARNVHRLREAKKPPMSITELARALRVGRPVVYDMEGARGDRQQREFKWTDLVALCGALNTTLFELVLPPEGIAVADVDRFPQMITDEPTRSSVVEGLVHRFEGGGPAEDIAGPRALSEPVVGRDGLSHRLFGMPIPPRGSDVLARFVKRAEQVEAARNAALAELEKQYLGEISRIHEEATRIRRVNETLEGEE